MPLEYFQSRNIPFLKLHFTMDGKEYPDDLGQTLSFEEFYKQFAAGALPTALSATPPSTTNPPNKAYVPILSPRNRNTQTGFKTGSRVPTRFASSAGMCLMPMEGVENKTTSDVVYSEVVILADTSIQ